LEVNQVSNRDSFKKFNTGWVLPEGSKRARVSGAPSSDSGGLRLLSDHASSSQKKIEKIVRESSSDLSEPEEAPLSSPRRRTRSGETEQSRKRQRALSTSAAKEETPVRIVARSKGGQFARIADLPRPRHSYAGETAQEAYNRKRREARRRKAKMKDGFAPSTLCWAKVEGHASHPAVIFDEDSDEVPEKVLDQKSKVKGVNGEEVHLVQFFGHTASFGWISTSRLKLMFEDRELDERMLKAPKTSKEKNVLRKAYDEASEQIEK
jgi:NuA3 HAT complex component NTO1